MACHRVIRGLDTATAACSWEEENVHTRLGRNDSFCLTSTLPYAAPGEYNMLVGDFTPNYLCDAEALPRLRRTAADPAALRFVVVMREPTARAFSEWAMFAMQWAWDPIGAFAPSFAMRVKHLRDCNATLFRNTALLKRLPTSELAKYLSRCWNSGGAMMYPQTSLYAVCVLHALRHFPRRQFLFLRYEDLMAMDHASILKLIGRFYGLYAGDDLVAAAEPSGRCQPAGGGRPKPAGGAKATGKRASTLRSDRRRTPSTYATISPEERILYNRSKLEIARDPEAYEALFGPYNELLSELVGHQGFRWDNPRKETQSEQPRRPNALAVDFLRAGAMANK